MNIKLINTYFLILTLFIYNLLILHFGSKHNIKIYLNYYLFLFFFLQNVR